MQDLSERNLAKNLFEKLLSLNNDPKSELNFFDDYSLIVAVILSAQCLDASVNKVTKELFAKYPDFLSLSKANVEDIEKIIKSVNFYKNKASNIIKMSAKVVEDFNGELPFSIKELCSLAGVGRKTAQVVMVEGKGLSEVPVDTHIFRIVNRAFNKNFQNVLYTENFIRETFEKETFVKLHKLLVLHGRYVCKAKVPDCENCILKEICKFNLNRKEELKCL